MAIPTSHRPDTMDRTATTPVPSATACTTTQKPTMNKEDLLDIFATAAMQAQIEKMGITNPFALAQTAYRMAKEMVEHRDRILQEWTNEEQTQYRYKNANLKDLDLPIRYHRCLTSENILMKEDLCNWTERDMRRIPNLGAKGLEFVKQAMASHGIKFKGEA